VEANTRVTVRLQIPLVVVPAVTGQTVSTAEGTLRERTLQLGMVTGSAKSPEPLPIVDQTPTAGTSVPANSRVDVTLQQPQVLPPPPPPVVVPYLERLSKVEATKVLSSIGLVVGNTLGADAGVVTVQSPSAGTQVAQGSAVDITLAVPIVQVEVPDMVGQGLAVAASRLGVLRLLGVPRYPQTSRDGKTMVVESQDPAPGTMVPAGSNVVLEMGGGSKPVPWKWVSIGIAFLALTGSLGSRIRHRMSLHTMVTTTPHSNLSKTKVNCVHPPAIRFTVRLKDRTSTAAYRSIREPEVLKKGQKL
jgi:hypothetical protein